MDQAGAGANAETLLAYEAAAVVYARAQAPPSPELLGFIDAFAERLPATAEVLELGSATGDEAALLEDRGLRVQRSDAALAFVNRLRDRGIPASVLNVLSDDLGGPWDGIFANAVFLHLDVPQLTAVLSKTAASVRPKGTLGFTLKEGDGASWTTEKLGHPRHFTYWREPGLRALLDASPWKLASFDRYRGEHDDWLQCLCSLREVEPSSA